MHKKEGSGHIVFMCKISKSVDCQRYEAARCYILIASTMESGNDKTRSLKWTSDSHCTIPLVHSTGTTDRVDESIKWCGKGVGRPVKHRKGGQVPILAP